uniref:Mediator of RNA polymerase II transcription subunit 4 n=1 Tax=Strigamia maritima TaxID=126957 RepID=T1JHT1_STRMM
METLQAEVDKQDQDIRQLQKHLKEAELVLATAIYQAKQKLQSISRANKQSISSEELIKYAHRISASNAVAAPLTWQQGDPRRPYPTDIEMRLGFLGRFSDLANNGHILQQQSSISDSMSLGRPGSYSYVKIVKLLRNLFIIRTTNYQPTRDIYLDTFE